MKRVTLLAVVLASTLGLFATATLRAQDKSDPDPQLQGYWRATAGKAKTILRFAPGRLARRTGTSFVGFLARYGKDVVALNMSGTRVTWRVKVDGGVLRLTRGGKSKPQLFEKLAAAPVGFAPVAFPLGRAKKLKRGKMKKIRSEFVRRARKDQQARNSSSTNEKKIAAIDKANTAYLKKMITKHGWIDLARFGEAGADGAWTLVIHSGDISLLLAAKAAMEKVPAEMKFRAGQNYATIVDRVAIYLGHKQSYGTQVVQDDRGHYVVFPVLDLPKIDARRKRLGMSTFDESLKVQSRWTGSKAKVQAGW